MIIGQLTLEFYILIVFLAILALIVLELWENLSVSGFRHLCQGHLIRSLISSG